MVLCRRASPLHRRLQGVVRSSDPRGPRPAAAVDRARCARCGVIAPRCCSARPSRICASRRGSGPAAHFPVGRASRRALPDKSDDGAIERWIWRHLVDHVVANSYADARRAARERGLARIRRRHRDPQRHRRRALRERRAGGSRGAARAGGGAGHRLRRPALAARRGCRTSPPRGIRCPRRCPMRTSSVGERRPAGAPGRDRLASARRFLGYRADVPRCSVVRNVVLPSHSEAFGLAAEAMGRRAGGGDARGRAAEVIDDGRTGRAGCRMRPSGWRMR